MEPKPDISENTEMISEIRLRVVFEMKSKIMEAEIDISVRATMEESQLKTMNAEVIKAELKAGLNANLIKAEVVKTDTLKVIKVKFKENPEIQIKENPEPTSVVKCCPDCTDGLTSDALFAEDVKRDDPDNTTGGKKSTSEACDKQRDVSPDATRSNKPSYNLRARQGKLLMSSTILNKDQQEETDNNHFECSQCSYVTSNKSTFTDHLKTHTRVSNLRRPRENQKTSQKSETPFNCPGCSYTSTYQDTYIEHLKTHGFPSSAKRFRFNEKKPHKCSFCKYSSANKSAILYHQRVHTGERPFKCTECDYTAIFKHNLTNHKRRHTGEKPYKCSYCPFAASATGTLSRHLRTHTGEKPFRCCDCNFASNRKHNLIDHQKRFH